ncbi:PRD domain-containing protein [Listeria rocourtiae]|uniref:PRD domain-containing protein n=1 Tax=Listeria rocourtiae TaxID=647910 RepID=UPI003D2F9AFC
MKISQILNNNVALVRRGGNEVFVVSKGIGFKKKKGQQITEEEVEKMYILDSFDMLDHFSYLLSHSDPNDILLISNIISYGEEKLGIKASDYLSLALLDHLEFLLKRVEKQQYIKSPLIWATKRFYPAHFQVGLKALKMIEEQKGLQLPEDEGVSLCLHFVNMEESQDSYKDRVLEVQTLSNLVSIVERHFNIVLDEKSANYMRFSSHLQYFVQRIIDGEPFNDGSETLELYKQVCQLYPESFKAVQKMKVYVGSQFGFEISINEETYLMLHINRVTERMEDKN